MPPCDQKSRIAGDTIKGKEEFSLEEISNHNKEHDAWIVLHGKVYNVSKFLNDHPGGKDIVLERLGTDISGVWSNNDYHNHSASAYKILSRYCVGVVEGWSGDYNDANAGFSEQMAPHLTKEVDKNFPTDIDWEKPIVCQVGTLGRNYANFIHEPKMLEKPARFFRSDYLEPFSRTVWYVVPLIWVPVVLGMAYYSTVLGLSVQQAVMMYASGGFAWTVFEYFLHRYIFHYEQMFQFSRWSITFHFLIHGVHHKLPQDPMRLVFPPTLATMFLAVLWPVFRMFLDSSETYAFTAGFMTGYIYYDMCHYFFHHGRPDPESHLGVLKKHHLAHHFKNPKLGYGLTSKIWDVVFDTKIDFNGGSTTTKKLE